MANVYPRRSRDTESIRNRVEKIEYVKNTYLVSLRRSIIGSLRSRTSSVPSEWSYRNESSLSGRETPGSKSYLDSIQEDLPPPPLEREFDLAYDSGQLPIEDTFFEKTVEGCKATSQEQCLFKLPPYVRKKIYKYCFPEEIRRITLSPYFATKAVFPEEYFASPWDILEPVSGALQASSNLRHEIMTYFWVEYDFHVSLSMLTGPIFSPLSNVWLTGYLPIVQHLTLEIDLTRFGTGALNHAPELGHDHTKLKNLVGAIADGLMKRRGESTMSELNLLCRSYAGLRYATPNDNGTELDVPYCPVEALSVCEPLYNLRGLIGRLRVSGFSLQFTQVLFDTIYQQKGMAPKCFVPNNCAWPPIPVRIRDIFHPSTPDISLMSPLSPICVSLTRSSSFTQEFEDAMSKYEPSISSDYTVSPSDDTVAQDIYDSGSDQGLMMRHIPRRYPSIAASFMSSDRGSISPNGLENDLTLPNTNDSGKELLTPTPQESSRTPTPTSPNTMNKMNEQDPAFLRTVQALRSPDLAPNPPVKPRPFSDPIRLKTRTKAFNPENPYDRSGTSTPTSEGSKRKYTSFLNKLRGRAVSS